MADYSEHYSESGFWNKMSQIQGLTKLIKMASDLYKALTDKDTPAWVKSLCVAALGYLIFPLDVIPDVIPLLGYGDDAGVLAGAVGSVAGYLPSSD